MIWRDGDCRISDLLIAEVWQPFNDGRWVADISCRDYCLWSSDGMPTEEAAKAAVCHWIGKTMAQFSNALAAGYEQPDDGA